MLTAAVHLLAFLATDDSNVLYYQNTLRQIRRAHLVPFFLGECLDFCAETTISWEIDQGICYLSSTKEVVRTLKFSGQALTIAACTFICIYDSGTFYLIQQRALKQQYSFVFSYSQGQLCSLIKEQIFWKKNYFAVSSLTKVIDERRLSFQVISFIII